LKFWKWSLNNSTRGMVASLNKKRASPARH
jgi:hypothetical protein